MGIEHFQIDFAKLVRKYMPELPKDAEGMGQLAAMQHVANCYAPFVWLGHFNPAVSERDREVALLKAEITGAIQKRLVPVNVRALADCGIDHAHDPAVTVEIDAWLRAGRPA